MMEKLSLNKEQRVLLSLIKSEVSGEEINISEDIKSCDFEKVMAESLSSAVPILALSSANKIKEYIPSEILSKWLNLSAKLLSKNLTCVKSQTELIDILNKGGYKYVIIKGTSAASYYDNPESRGLGDVDFLVLNSEKDLIKKTLTDNGYRAEMENHECHVVFFKGYSHLEMHFETVGIPSGKLGDYIRDYLKDVPLYPENAKYGELTFNSPKPVYHAIILLLHLQHHLLSEGVGLRHLTDVAYFVNKTYNESFWKEELIPFLNKTGLTKFTATIIKTCHLYLGSKNIDFGIDVPDEICEELISDVLDSGNFGRKDDNKKRSGALISNHGKSGTKHGAVYNAFGSVHRAVKNRHTKTYKSVLYPFLYVYECIRYAFLIMIGKRPSYGKMKKLASARKEIYNKLEVFENNKVN